MSHDTKNPPRPAATGKAPKTRRTASARTPAAAKKNGTPAPAARPRGFLDRVLEKWEMDAVRPEPESLDRLHTAYITRVPFENATKLVKAARAGNPETALRGPVEFWEEYLRWGSGGTCFAVTAAYQFLLRYLGFTSRLVFCHLPGNRPKAHSALLVELDGKRILVDVGYALPAPVALPEQGTVRRSTPYYDVEIRTGPGEEYLVFSEDDRGQRFRYRFQTGPVTEADYQAAWRRTFHPDAPYMRRLALGRFQDGTRLLYKDGTSIFEITRAGETSRVLEGPPAEALAASFGLAPALVEAALHSLERLTR